MQWGVNTYTKHSSDWADRKKKLYSVFKYKKKFQKLKVTKLSRNF